MSDYLTLGHMKIATKPGRYFIPHHVVLKAGDDVSKLRVVFDASSKSSTGLSLNDILCTDPSCKQIFATFYSVVDLSDTF